MMAADDRMQACVLQLTHQRFVRVRLPDHTVAARFGEALEQGGLLAADRAIGADDHPRRIVAGAHAHVVAGGLFAQPVGIARIAVATGQTEQGKQQKHQEQ